uniref:NADH-ubiquinone oxidoreductase chain 5 n=1 Tax=Aenasius arizonensis TaxID=2058190 RepID=A0A6B9XQM9_9HYME|nr:NADH dehydrogenase subunit 5 [Aenasius arizonensis]QHR84896.1 NADH dehydrogenase subunit 5 [Aenasius arizonensis]
MILYYLSGIFFFFFSLWFFIFSLMFMIMKISIFMEWNLLMLNSVKLDMLIYLDWVSLLFVFTVLLISSMIMFYCCEYMLHDLNNTRFFFLVFFFIISMMLMILSPNMVSIILGWDGLGLVSYCLVIYYNNYFSYNSGMLTVLMNRIGDVMIMLSISVMFIYGSMNFMNLNYFNKMLFMMIVIAAFTKSAQFPFSSWLPAAMAAPTPVSALVHSSTLVTAGVYLLIRFNYMIYKSGDIVMFIMIIGMLTMMMAGLSANFEFDLKKIIAFSTLSQLGLMMLIYGYKFWVLAYFHLIVHAMFKSMMFMCSGVIIHMMCNVQDIRYMGNLFEFMPLTMIMFMISNFSLCGFPFMSGFFSKDKILEVIIFNKFSLIMMLFLLISTMLTLMYSVRLSLYLMNKDFKFYVIYKIGDFKLMNLSMFILFINSIFFGFFMNWLIFSNIEDLYLLFFEKIMVIFSLFVSLYLSILKFRYSMKNMFLNYFLGKMWFLYYMNSYLTMWLLSYMKHYYNLVDKGWNEYLINKLIKNLMEFFSLNLYGGKLESMFLLIIYIMGLVLMI